MRSLDLYRVVSGTLSHYDAVLPSSTDFATNEELANLVVFADHESTALKKVARTFREALTN